MSLPLATQYEILKTAFEKKPCDVQRCVILLGQLKLALVESGLLLPTREHLRNDLVIARDILEIGAFISIRNRDEPSFDRYYSQLQAFYTDFANELPPSSREHPILGLNLIRLLTLRRIAEFHTVLEGLPKELLHDNPFIRHPVNLEQWLMEGSYSKVWGARAEAPAEEYTYFVDSLMGTIREEIASCSELAYETLPIEDAATLLFFSTGREVVAFAQERKWIVNLGAGTIGFGRAEEESETISKRRIMSGYLQYCRELEQIV